MRRAQGRRFGVGGTSSPMGRSSTRSPGRGLGRVWRGTGPHDHPPRYLWDREVEGETILRVRVDRDGSVAEVRVAVPSGEAAFDSAAVRALRVARFEPARSDGTQIDVWATLPVVFSKKPG